MGGDGGERLWVEPWPQPDEAFLVQETVTVVVQVNGKLRDRMEAPAGLSEAELVAIARERPRVAAAIEASGGQNGARVLREVVVPDRLVNLVVG